MVSRWAHVLDGVVDNVSLWDGNTDTWTPPANGQMIELADDQNVGPGDTYDGTTFAHVDPFAPVTVPVDVDPAVISALLTQAAKATTVSATVKVLTTLLQQLSP